MSRTEHTYTIGHAFAGIGGGALGTAAAAARLGEHVASFRTIGGIDNDELACQDFERLVGAPCLRADVHTLTPAELRTAWGEEAPDVVLSSPPCLPGVGPVLTPNGPVPIETIRANDLVLTHRGRFAKVRAVGTHEYQGIMVGLRLNGTVDVQEFTAEHPIWRRRVVRPGPGKVRQLGEPEFVRAEEVREGDRVGFPVDREVVGTAKRFVDRFGDPRLVTRKPSERARGYDYSTPRIVDLRSHAMGSALWFLLGAYIGDGYRRPSRHEVIFCVGPADGETAQRVRTALDRLCLTWYEDRHGGPTNVKLRVNSVHLSGLCGAFGDGAEQKDIPPELMHLERHLAHELIAGYRATDGSEAPRRRARNMLQARWKIASISLPLLRSLQRLLLRFDTFGKVHQCWHGGEQTIEGRTVQTRPRWELIVTLEPRKRTIHEFIDGVVWVRVRTVTRRAALEKVWNLEVDEDDTFCAPLIATHNCKGFSGLLSAERAAGEKYQRLNRLLLDMLFLMCSTWELPPRIIFVENVPRITARGKHLLHQVRETLTAHGYAVTPDDTHNCGELGGLAQNRQRFFLVARCRRRVPKFIYQPPKQRVRACGEVLGPLPMPGDLDAGGPMHALPRLSWRNWVRLALIPAGGDWRDLPGALPPGTKRRERFKRHRMEAWDQPVGTVGGSGSNGPGAVADPRLSDALGVRPDTAEDRAAWEQRGEKHGGGTKWFKGKHGVLPWDEPARTVVGGPSNGAAAVADPRFGPQASNPNRHEAKYRVTPWEEPAHAVTGARPVTSGGPSVADPRIAEALKLGRAGDPEAFGGRPGMMGLLEWGQPAPTVTGGVSVMGGSTPRCVADPRVRDWYNHVLRVTGWDDPAGTVTGAGRPSSGAVSVADPRLGCEPRAGAYRVLGWEEAAGTITGSLSVDNGPAAVADPRLDPDKPPPFIPLIIAADGTWHRPLTTLELAVLQGFDSVMHGKPFVLAGTSTTRWREAIGNAIPPPAAKAIGDQLLLALLSSELGEWTLGTSKVWVAPGAAEEVQHEAAA